jgi:hypothetical protein
MAVASPGRGPPPPAGEILFRPRLPHRLLKAAPGWSRLSGVMGVLTARAGGAQAGRRTDGGSPPAIAVSIDVHDLLLEVCDPAVPATRGYSVETVAPWTDTEIRPTILIRFTRRLTNKHVATLSPADAFDCRQFLPCEPLSGTGWPSGVEAG